ncbi:MAG: hypothetical protein ACI909_002330 [Planctomycetota bacterium]|jgi:hypothetical protein
MIYRDNAFSVPIRIHYRPPRSLLYLMAFSHFGAALCLLLSSLPYWLSVLLILLVTACFSFFYQDFNKQQVATITPQLCLGKENEWSLIDGNDEVRSIKLRPSALAHSLLLVLRFSDVEGRSYSFILNAENVEKNTLRRLRVRLLHGTNIS